MSLRLLVGALALAFVLALAGCGDDDDEAGTVATSPPAETETTATETEETATEPETTEEAPEPDPETDTAPEAEPPATSPEEEPGGAGDEEPARSLALFTAQNGRIRPRLVRVPPFISIRVELRAGDGNTYALTIGGKTIAVGEGVSSMSATLDGLRPGDAYVGRPKGAQGAVRIEASAEPGP